MSVVDKSSTKEKILQTAAKMFSERGYDKVTMREIADAVGIKAATIYHHFSSKEDILLCLYKFYTAEQRKLLPDLDELLRLAETEPPFDVLMKTEFHYDEDIRGILDHILVTAARRIGADPESEQFLQDNIFDPVSNTLRTLLERMVVLNKIKPLDIDLLLKIMTYFCFSAAALNNSRFGQGVAEYQAAMFYIFTLITPIEEE